MSERKNTYSKFKALWKQSVRDYTTINEDIFIEHCAESFDLMHDKYSETYRLWLDAEKHIKELEKELTNAKNSN